MAGVPPDPNPFAADTATTRDRKCCLVSFRAESRNLLLLYLIATGRWVSALTTGLDGDSLAFDFGCRAHRVLALSVPPDGKRDE